MPIKLKNIPPDIDKSIDSLQSDIKNVSFLSEEKIDYAKRKLKAACNASDLIKKNSERSEKEDKKLKNLDLLQSFEAKDTLTALNATIKNNSQVSQASQQRIKAYLSDLASLATLRKENQLVYGKKDGKQDLSLGLGLVNSESQSQAPLFKKAFTSTILYAFHKEQGVQTGAVEFGITYDNKIFIVAHSEHSPNNLYKMAQGTLLKAVGCLQIGNREIKENVDGSLDSKILEGRVEYISVYNAFFEAPQDNIAVSLFALKKLKIDLSRTQVVIPNNKAPFIKPISGCRITIRGEIQNTQYYLNETRFPGAKALAEKQLTFFDKLVKLFCTIDDNVLIKRNKKFIEEVYEEKELLKLNLIKLFNFTEKHINKTGKKTRTLTKPTELINQPSTSSSQTIGNHPVKTGADTKNATKSFNDYWQAVKKNIEFLAKRNLKLNFLVEEIDMMLAYILQNGLTSETEGKNQLEELENSTATTQEIPGRGLKLDNIPNYIKFYDQNPIKTCMALLKNYSKGDGWRGVICRFFTGAWNRNYKEPVNKLLSAYSKNELPDNLTICGVYNKLKDGGLIFNFDAESKSSLRKMLFFCAKLNKEEEGLRSSIGSSLIFFPPFVQSRPKIGCFNF
jgi:hypothetical protein